MGTWTYKQTNKLLGMIKKRPKWAILVLKWPVFNNTEKMKNFKIWDKWKKSFDICSSLSSMFPHWFWAIWDKLVLSSTIFKKIHFVKFAHLERFSIVLSCTFFLWSRPEPPIQVRFSKTKFHAHLQTYRFHTNALDCCSVHPSWRSCAFKIGGTFFLGRRKYTQSSEVTLSSRIDCL